MHDILNSVLKSLSAQPPRSFWVYVRSLTLSIVVLLLPSTTAYMLLTTYDLPYTFITVIIGNAFVSVQILESLIIFCLYLYDAKVNETLEWLDHVIFYIKATVGFLQLVRVCLYLSALWAEVGYKLVFLFIAYVYLTIWEQLQSIRTEYKNRRNVIQITNGLQTATQDQIGDHDNCPICYHSLSTATITNCGHYFHSVCLRNLLHKDLSEVCPLCRQPINVRRVDFCLVSL